MFFGRGGMDVYGCLWMFMGIFCNNFLELGDPNQKSFLEGWGELAPVTGPRGPMRFKLFGHARQI